MLPAKYEKPRRSARGLTDIIQEHTLKRKSSTHANRRTVAVTASAECGNMVRRLARDHRTEVLTTTMEAIGALIGLLSFGLFGIVWLLMFAFIIAVMALWVWMLVDVVRREFKDDNTKLVWVLVVILAGWVGAAVYYFVGRQQGVIPEAPPAAPQRPEPQT